jgi:hypothetical protein
VQDAEAEQSPGAQGQKRTERNTAENFHESVHRVLMARNLRRASCRVMTTVKDCAFIFTSLYSLLTKVRFIMPLHAHPKVRVYKLTTPARRFAKPEGRSRSKG